MADSKSISNIMNDSIRGILKAVENSVLTPFNMVFRPRRFSEMIKSLPDEENIMRPYVFFGLSLFLFAFLGNLALDVPNREFELCLLSG